MWLLKVVFILMIIIVFSLQSYADTSYNQVVKVLLFYDLITVEENPNIKHFFELFGRDNEAELELFLRLNFPELDITVNWFDNQEAKKNIDELYRNPEKHLSKFLECIKLLEPKLFSKRLTRMIEFPPKESKGFQIYRVLTGNKIVSFQFSQNEDVLDDIILPNGKSIYTLIPKCVNSKIGYTKSMSTGAGL